MQIYSFSPGKIFSAALIFISALLFAQPVDAQFYNGTQMQFGKNRVQYDDRFWSFFRHKNFETYYYVGGKELAEYTGSVAGKDIEEIEKLFDFALEGKIQYLIYNKLSDAKQSNIGLHNDEVQNNIGGYTRIVGNKVFIYFEGDHERFHRMIRAGTAKVLLDEIMYGGDVRERLQNAALLFMPEWYEKGLISYVSFPWDTKMDNLMRDGVVSEKMLKLNSLTGEQAMIAGHSMWRYITETYGESSVSNLLYMTRLNRNIESGMQFVLGVSLRTLTDNWKEWLITQYSDTDDKSRSIPAGKPVIKKAKKDIAYTRVNTSPDSRYSVFTSNDLGKYKIKIRNHQDRKTKKILKSGFRSYMFETDVSFPLTAWHPSGRLVAIIRERKGKLMLGTYTLETKKYEESQLFNFEKVLDFAYSDDGQLLVMSAIQKGQSDIFVYNMRTRTYDQVTKDIADDMSPRFFRNSTKIIFSSNRDNDTLSAKPATDTLPPGSYDIFMYDYAGKNDLLRRVTSTSNINEINPVAYDSMTIAYLGDNNGIYNRFLARIDSVISFIDTTEHYRYVIETQQQTDYYRNILFQDVNPSMTKLSEMVFENGRYKMYMHDIKPWEEASIPAPVNTAFRNSSSKGVAINQPGPDVIQPKEGTQEEEKETPETDTSKIDINNYVFQSEFPKSKRQKEDVTPNADENKESAVKPQQQPTDSVKPAPVIKPRNYEISFTADYVVTQLDNGLLNATYQPFIPGGGGYYNPGLNGFLKLGINDLLEDLRITGGVRITADLNGSEYFLSYENLKRRMDKQLLLYRASQVNDAGFFYYRAKTHQVMYRVSWPFSEVSSVRGSMSYRNDRQVILSSDVGTLLSNDASKNWITPKVEYIFDNTISRGLNLYNGTRLKIFGEYFKNMDDRRTDMYVVGADIRHYQKVHRQIIWANRIAGSASYGDQKVIFYMGGVDNWFSPEFNHVIPIDFSQNYAYQAIATPMRGFDQNIRNGNKFILVNSELRIPIFTYLLNRPVQSDFIRNFQVIGFADAGTSWTGPDPYDQSNSLNNVVIPSPPYTITLVYQREPVVAGYGFGLRSRVLGYFLRADWAWGYEDGVHLPQKFYFSFALDF